MNDMNSSVPRPIIDNLDEMDNPFHVNNFEVPYYTDKRFIKDYEFALKFLYSYNGSPATFKSYRRELERLLQWSWLVADLSIFELKRNDIEEFLHFCIKPPESWIGLKNVARFKNVNGERVFNEEWKLFVVNIPKASVKSGIKPDFSDYSLSQSSLQAIFSVLSSFFNYLCQEQVSESNPVMMIRQKSKFLIKSKTKDIKRISNLQWDYVIETVELMANEKPETHERTLFIIKSLLGMYLRVSELVSDKRSTPVMGDFKRDSDNNWWFHVTGKGNKVRKITVSDEMLQALRRYRLYLGLSPLPYIDEPTPLIAKVLGKGPITSTRQIRVLLQESFDKAHERMKIDGLGEDAEELRVATVHWLRHTAISEDIKDRPRDHVRDDAGHTSMQTTDKYVQSELRERHASGKKKRLSNL